MYHHVLCAYDGSPAAKAALSEAIELASSMNARLAIVTVVERAPAGVAAAGVDPEALAHTMEDERHTQLREAADQVPDDLPLTTLLRHGHAAKEIVKAAAELGADVLVLGTRGRSRMASNLFGSVAADVHFHTKLPILVVSAQEPH